MGVLNIQLTTKKTIISQHHDHMVDSLLTIIVANILRSGLAKIVVDFANEDKARQTWRTSKSDLEESKSDMEKSKSDLEKSKSDLEQK